MYKATFYIKMEADEPRQDIGNVILQHQDIFAAMHEAERQCEVIAGILKESFPWLTKGHIEICLTRCFPQLLLFDIKPRMDDESLPDKQGYLLYDPKGPKLADFN